MNGSIVEVQQKATSMIEGLLLRGGHIITLGCRPKGL